jgi:hypothetical protein
MSKPKAGALGIETGATDGALNGRYHARDQPQGLVLTRWVAHTGLQSRRLLFPGFRCGRSPRFTPFLPMGPFS